VGEYVIIYRVEGEDVLILHVIRGSREFEALFTALTFCISKRERHETLREGPKIKDLQVSKVCFNGRHAMRLRPRLEGCRDPRSARPANAQGLRRIKELLPCAAV
jgi:hypothetical protein